MKFFSQLRERLNRADAYDEQRHIHNEDRLAAMNDRIVERDALHKREMDVLREKIAILEGRVSALDYWTRDVGRAVGAAGTAPTEGTEIVDDNYDPLDFDNFDEELTLAGLMVPPMPEPDAEHD